VHLQGGMRRHAVVLTDSESEGEGEDEPELLEAELDGRVHRLRPLVEAYEFAVRNVQLGGDYLEAASEWHARLQSLGAVLFEQAVSPRWSPAFVAVLKRARALRVCTHLPLSPSDQPRTDGRCLACGAKEQSSTDTLELLADDGGVNACTLANLSGVFDALDARDLAMSAGRCDPYYCGTFTAGPTCLDLATAAVLARNLVLDTCWDLRSDLDEVLHDETIVAQLERDEHASDPQIAPITNCTDVARRLVMRIRAIEDVLRGKPYPIDPELQRTGTGALWERVDDYKPAQHALHFSGARARALVLGTAEPPTRRAPPPPPPPPPPVARTRARTRAGARREAPIASRTRQRRAELSRVAACLR